MSQLGVLFNYLKSCIDPISSVPLKGSQVPPQLAFMQQEKGSEFDYDYVLGRRPVVPHSPLFWHLPMHTNDMRAACMYWCRRQQEIYLDRKKHEQHLFNDKLKKMKTSHSNIFSAL